jgi:hypothetical protein
MKRIRHGVAVLLLMIGVQTALAQEGATSTPLQINLVTPTPAAITTLPGVTATWTSTPVPLAVLTAIDTANVRAEPNINGALLGQIRAGERFTVSGRYFEWYQFQYDRSPNGRAWVFGQLVTIEGDPNAIPEITDEPAATIDPLVAGATQTLNAIILTPGGDLTATEAARGVISTLVIPGVVNNGRATELPAGTSLPTFTFPPGLVQDGGTSIAAQAVTPEPTIELTESALLSTLPPIVPILALGTLGILGLIFSSRNRGKR